jgi:hypothetical protein
LNEAIKRILETTFKLNNIDNEFLNQKDEKKIMILVGNLYKEKLEIDILAILTKIRILVSQEYNNLNIKSILTGS